MTEIVVNVKVTASKFICPNCHRLFFLSLRPGFDCKEVIEALVDHCDKYGCPPSNPELDLNIEATTLGIANLV